MHCTFVVMHAFPTVMGFIVVYVTSSSESKQKQVTVVKMQKVMKELKHMLENMEDNLSKIRQ